jgi:hypothetical protein
MPYVQVFIPDEETPPPQAREFTTQRGRGGNNKKVWIQCKHVFTDNTKCNGHIFIGPKMYRTCKFCGHDFVFPNGTPKSAIVPTPNAPRPAPGTRGRSEERTLAKTRNRNPRGNNNGPRAPPTRDSTPETMRGDKLLEELLNVGMSGEDAHKIVTERMGYKLKPSKKVPPLHAAMDDLRAAQGKVAKLKSDLLGQENRMAKLVKDVDSCQSRVDGLTSQLKEAEANEVKLLQETTKEVGYAKVAHHRAACLGPNMSSSFDKINDLLLKTVDLPDGFSDEMYKR